VHWGCHYATALDIEVDPQRRRFDRRESDFALQRLVECRALETKRVRLVALRWYSSGSEVRLGLVCLLCVFIARVGVVKVCVMMY
jgi:hypothetical protein